MEVLPGARGLRHPGGSSLDAVSGIRPCRGGAGEVGVTTWRHDVPILILPLIELVMFKVMMCVRVSMDRVRDLENG